MYILKKAGRYFALSLAGFISFVLLYLLLARVLPYIPVNSDYIPPEKGITVYVCSNGVHTDLVVPVQDSLVDWRQSFPYSDFEAADSSEKWIAFGWGDKGFYLETPTWAELKFSTAFKAAFFLSSTAMHVEYRSSPEKSTDYRRLVLSKEQYQKLVEYIREPFDVAASGKFVRIDHKGYWKTDRFYEARGTYSFLKTCNVWTGNGLKAIGVKTGIWTPFDSGVFRQLPERKP